MSEEARSVVSVLVRVSADPGNWEELSNECKSMLDSVPTSTFLHGAATVGIPPQFLKLVGLDPQVVATYSTQLVEDSTVARRQYQRVIGEHTRALTYDLLGECPEGYARALRLFTDVSLPPDQIWENALGIIGRFSLEPFKMLSLWVTVLLDSPHSMDAFVEWVGRSVWANHPDWIAVFKLVGQWEDLSELAAKFLVHNVLDFSRVYAYVDPHDAGFANYESKWETSKVETGNNALAMAMPLADDDDDDEDDEEELMKAEGGDADGQNTNGKSNSSNGKEDSDSMDVDSSETQNQLVENTFVLFGQVLLELLQTPNPELESTVLKIIYTHPLAFGASEKVARGLSALIAARLPENGIEGVTKLIMPHAIYEPAWSALSEKADLQFFREYMLPSIDLHPDHQPMLWSLPSTVRYALYTELSSHVASSNIIVKARFSQAEKDTKDILKRLTKQDAESLIVPQLLDIFARCPWPSLNVFINQVESYNIGQLVARSSSSQIAPLAMDMLPLILMQQFTAEGRVTKQQDGLFDQKWFKLLAQFAGDVAVAYESFDFVSLIKLVLQQFVERDFSEVVVIEQLLRRLSGIPSQSNLSVTQLLALSTAEPVSTLVSAAISEQYDPQRERFLLGLREADMVSDLFLALAFAYQNTTGSDAKVVATQLDQITNIVLTYSDLLEDPIDAKVLQEAGVPPEFAKAAMRHKSGPCEFWNLHLYDVAMSQDMYAKFMDICDPKAVERASLSHRLRVKNVQQQLVNSPKPTVPEIISRMVLSPSDAIFTSRYIQAVMPDAIPTIFTRDVVLTLLRSATPMETESFSSFLTDMFSFCYTNMPVPMDSLRAIHMNVTGAILEAVYPDAAYTPLSNAFSLLQRCLVVFPLFQDNGTALVNRIRLLTTTTRGDLETAVKSLSPQLAKRTSFWQSPENETVAQEFLDLLQAHSDRLMTRLVSSVKLVPKKEDEKEEKDEKEEEDKGGRRMDSRRKSRSRRSRRW